EEVLLPGERETFRQISGIEPAILAGMERTGLDAEWLVIDVLPAHRSRHLDSRIERATVARLEREPSQGVAIVLELFPCAPVPGRVATRLETAFAPVLEMRVLDLGHCQHAVRALDYPERVRQKARGIVRLREHPDVVTGLPRHDQRPVVRELGLERCLLLA